jgi:uncharacterized protein YjiS (DUF1127 family)
MWLTHKLLDQSATTLRQARVPEALDVPFTLNSSSSIATVGALPAHHKRPIKNSLAQVIKGVLQDMRRRGPAEVFSVWHVRRHYRRELQRLLAVGPHMIADIGLTLDNAREEMARPFWRA